MRNISYSPQSPEVFHDTIKNNILLGRDGDYYQAAMNSCFIETVMKFPNKFDTIISHSLSSLSGGERSRLSIARSILNHPDLIILDDVFSGLDIDMSIEIINNLKRDYQSSIIFIVTNQSELLELMDRVIRFPLDEGKAYER
jgi:ABC-type multidrug transport system fused ATPase/permease subunit